MRKNISFIGGAAFALAIIAATAPALVSAQTAGGQTGGFAGRGAYTPPAARGTVASVSGDTITLTGSDGTTYAVDATNAAISKFVSGKRTTIQPSDVATGDTLSVFGAATGTNIAATRIIDGVMPARTERGDAGTPGTAAAPKPKRISVSGTVASVSGTTITLTAKDGTSYAVDASKARTRRRAGAAMGLADIQTGDSIAVMGTLNGTDITAIAIRDASMGRKNDHTTGTITAVNGSSFTLQTKANASLTVNTSASTVIEKFIGNAKQAAALSDLAVGENMLITGSVDSAANSIDATIVRIEIKRVSKTGVVQSVSGNVITLTAKDGTTFTADATNAKLMRRFGAAILDVSVIQTGDTLTVTGFMNGDTLTVSSIRDTSLQARNGTFAGGVTAVNGASFTIQSKNRGVQTINTASTTVFKNGKNSAALTDIAVGQTVVVSGVWDRTNSNVTASKVTIKQ